MLTHPARSVHRASRRASSPVHAPFLFAHSPPAQSSGRRVTSVNNVRLSSETQSGLGHPRDPGTVTRVATPHALRHRQGLRRFPPCGNTTRDPCQRLPSPQEPAGQPGPDRPSRDRDRAGAATAPGARTSPSIRAIFSETLETGVLPRPLILSGLPGPGERGREPGAFPAAPVAAVRLCAPLPALPLCQDPSPPVFRAAFLPVAERSGAGALRSRTERDTAPWPRARRCACAPRRPETGGGGAGSMSAAPREFPGRWRRGERRWRRAAALR